MWSVYIFVFVHGACCVAIGIVVTTSHVSMCIYSHTHNMQRTIYRENVSTSTLMKGRYFLIHILVVQCFTGFSINMQLSQYI